MQNTSTRVSCVSGDSLWLFVGKLEKKTKKKKKNPKKLRKKTPKLQNYKKNNQRHLFICYFCLFWRKGVDGCASTSHSWQVAPATSVLLLSVLDHRVTVHVMDRAPCGTFWKCMTYTTFFVSDQENTNLKSTKTHNTQQATKTALAQQPNHSFVHSSISHLFTHAFNHCPILFICPFIAQAHSIATQQLSRAAVFCASTLLARGNGSSNYLWTCVFAAHAPCGLLVGGAQLVVSALGLHAYIQQARVVVCHVGGAG